MMRRGPTRKSWRPEVIPLLIFLLMSSTRSAQAFSIDFNRLSVDEGLSQSGVTQILQDRQGFIWLGTQDGLNRYDGHTFVVYHNDAEDTNSLCDNFVTALCEDSKGTIWVGTNIGGLDRLNKNDGSFTHYGRSIMGNNPNEKNIVTSVVEDDAHRLWIGTGGGGLWRFNLVNGQFKNYTSQASDSNSLSHNTVWTIQKDRSGIIWIGTYDGLCRYDPESDLFIRYHLEANSPQNSLTNCFAMMVDHSGFLWCGMWKRGLYTFDPTSGRFLPVNWAIEKDQKSLLQGIMALSEDPSGNLWIGTWNSGILQYDGKTMTPFHYDEGDSRSLSDDAILSMFTDRTGDVWIGTNSGGVCMYSSGRKGFCTYRHIKTDASSLAHNNVWAFAEDRRGNIWIGMNGGGVDEIVWGEDHVTHYGGSMNNPNGLLSSKIVAAIEDQEGMLWFGSEDAGVFRFDPARSKFAHFAHNPADATSLRSNFVTCMYEDRAGSLWIGTYGAGLHLFDKKTGRCTVYQHDEKKSDGIGQNTVMAIRQSRNGTLWLGTYSNGLDRFDGNTFTHYRNVPSDPGSLSNDRVISLYEDTAGVLWIGTWGGGLNRFDPSKGTFTHFTQKDGLPNSTIYGIEADERGRLWLSTNNGLVLFNVTARTFRTYHRIDGLQHDEFNQGAHLRLRNGELLFGGINGFSRFYPDNVEDNLIPPPVELTSFEVMGPSHGGRVAFGAPEIRLRYDQNFFSFDLAALDYTDSRRNKYAHKLEGFDASWIQTGTQHRATYTNVPPGNYTIRTAVSNSDGTWNWNGSQIRLIIVPPPWRRWWAYLFYSLAVVASILWVTRRRMRQQEEERAHHRIELENREHQLAQERLISNNLRRAEEALKENESKLRRAQEMAGLGSWEWDPATDRMTCSNELLKIFGIDRQQFAGTLTWMLGSSIHPEERQMAKRAIQRSLEPGVGEAVEYRITTPGGDVRWIRSLSGPIFEEGNPVRVTGISQDITERRHAEESLRHAQKLESIGTLAGGIAHDFNNLLNAILGQSELALNKLPHGSPAENNLNKAIKAAMRAADLTRQLLAYSGKGKFVMEDINLNRLVKDNVQILEVSVPKTANLRFELNSTAPNIRGDAGQIQQVVMNLIINAGEALEANPGRITVRTAQITLMETDTEFWRYTHDPLSPGEYILIQVADTGHGIAKEKLSCIFDPFYSTKFTGRGLGLAAVLGIVRGHLGGIRIVSEVGKGTQFDIVFPMVKAETISHVQAASDQRVVEGKGRTVLVIDDELFVLDLVTDIFTEAGFVVLGALNPLDGIELYRLHHDRIVVVILDYSMPGLDGRAAFEELRKINENVWVLLCSGYTEEETTSAFSGARPVGFIQKPYRARVVLDYVQKILQMKPDGAV